MKSIAQITPKKTYQRPRLKVYGAIKSLTATNNAISPTDDGGLSGGMTKTH